MRGSEDTGENESKKGSDESRGKKKDKIQWSNTGSIETYRLGLDRGSDWIG